MAKEVRYNGDTESFCYCSRPNKLVVGEVYEVVGSTRRDWHTNYILKGVDGEFYSGWFNGVPSKDFLER